jgi:hippurate hydrolase
VNQGIPGFYLSLGGADPGRFAAAKSGGAQLPSNHSPLFAPDADPALQTGVAAETAMLRDLLRGTSKQLRESLTIAQR